MVYVNTAVYGGLQEIQRWLPVDVHLPTILKAFSRRILTIIDQATTLTMAQPIPTPVPMRTHRGAPNGVRLLACVSNGHIELGIVWAMDHRPCSLAP